MSSIATTPIDIRGGQKVANRKANTHRRNPINNVSFSGAFVLAGGCYLPRIERPLITRDNKKSQIETNEMRKEPLSPIRFGIVGLAYAAKRISIEMHRSAPGRERSRDA